MPTTKQPYRLITGTAVWSKILESNHFLPIVNPTCFELKTVESLAKALGPGYKSRNSFIARRESEIFGGEWISLRHLSNIEEGKNLPSIELLIRLAYALEIDPVDLFSQILKLLSSTPANT